MKAALITLGSVLLTTAVIGNAYYQKKQFYPSVVYITKSNPSMAVSNQLSQFSLSIQILSNRSYTCKHSYSFCSWES